MKTEKFFLGLILLFASSFLFAIKPNFSLKTTGSVIDFIYENNTLYAATDQGVVDVFNVKRRKRISTIKIPDIQDFMGDKIPAKIYSIDKIFGKDGILLVSQEKGGFRNIYLYKNKKLHKIVDGKKDRLLVREARFINTTTIFLGLMSNELIKMDIKTKKIFYRRQVNTSTFSDMVFDEQKKNVFTANESGIVYLYDLAKGNKRKTYEGNHVDNIYQLDYKQDMIITAGQDRRLGIYNTRTGSRYYLHADFLIYSVGLSPSGKLGAYAATEQNDIFVFNTATKQKLYTLQGQKSTLTKIYFIDEKSLITTSEDPKILFWKLK